MEDGAIRFKETNGIIIFTIMKDFTIAMDKTVQTVYQNFTEKGYKKFLFEFKPGNHITSGGIAILIGILGEIRKRDQQLSITGLSNHFKKTFNMIGISRYTSIYNSIEEAIHMMSFLN